MGAVSTPSGPMKINHHLTGTMFTDEVTHLSPVATLWTHHTRVEEEAAGLVMFIHI